MRTTACLLTILMSTAGFAHAQSNALPEGRHILVYGDAQARAIPDRFKITLTFSVVDMKADVARAKLEAHLRDAIAKLKASSVPTNEIVATSLEIAPKKEYDDTLKKQVFKGIEVTRKLTARFDDQDNLKNFLSVLDTSEDVQVSGVATELSTEEELRRQLRQKAIESTRERSVVIAKAYGVRLAGLYSVSDTAPQFKYGITEGSWPSMHRWNADSTTLDRIEVTGSRIARSDTESFEMGYVNFDDKIYAVFLITD